MGQRIHKAKGTNIKTLMEDLNYREIFLPS
jgi:hypothetical protein